MIASYFSSTEEADKHPYQNSVFSPQYWGTKSVCLSPADGEHMHLLQWSEKILEGWEMDRS